MLDLNPRVHFHEVEIFTRLVDEVFDGSGIFIADGFDQTDRSIAHALAHCGRYQGRGTLFDDLLVAALHRAIALTQMHEITMGIGDDLELDVVRIQHQFFQVALAITEAGNRFVRGSSEERMEFFGLEAGTHATATTTSCGLDHHREADFFGLRKSFVGIDDDFRAGSDRHAIGNRIGTSRSFVAHHRNHFRGGSDELDAR